MKKKFLFLAMVALLVSSLAGCGNKGETKTETPNENVGTVTPDANDNPAVVEQDTDDDNDQNTQNMISIDDLGKGKCMLTNESDGISFTQNTGEYTESTYYYYKDGALQSVETAHMYKEKEAAKADCDKLNADENKKKEYSSIVADENIVYMLWAQDKVDSLKSLNQQQLYDKLKSEHPDAMTEETINNQANSDNGEKKEENK